MAITLTTPECGPGSFAGFIVNGVSTDASGCEVLKAGVTGKSIYINQMFIGAS